ncbi:MAG: hypothetical protein MJA30_15520, partial [Cytophagales bacterium]|nr:hypothetical protein [Cytophagales bacterium]
SYYVHFTTCPVLAFEPSIRLLVMLVTFGFSIKAGFSILHQVLLPYGPSDSYQVSDNSSLSLNFKAKHAHS